MEEELDRKYREACAFWDRALLTQETAFEGIDPEKDWKNIGSATLLALFDALGGRDHWLNYGCGSGWAEVVLKRLGCRDILGVDLSANGIASARRYAAAFGENDVRYEQVDRDWLSAQPESSFDHVLCINVIDVVPDEVADGIIRGLARVLRPGQKAFIGTNPCFDREAMAKREGVVWEGPYLFQNGILRLNNHTDEEWLARFAPYFVLDRLAYFHWDVEADTAKRRLFFLTKK